MKLRGKRMTALAVGLALSLTLALPSLAAETAFTPAEAGARLQTLGIYQGNSSGDLMLDKGLTRGELAVLLARLDDPKEEFATRPDSFGYLCGFPDVPDWARSAVGFCWNRRLLKGYDTGLYGAADMVTPAMACTVVLRTYGHKSDEGAAWSYNTASAYAVSLGWIGEGAVQGLEISRGDMAVLICNAMGEKATPQPPTQTTPQPGSEEDYATQANPAVFTGKYTQKMYNAFRYAILHQADIDNGTYQPVSLGAKAEVTKSAALAVSTRVGGGSTRFWVADAIDGSAVYLYAEHDPAYDAATAHVRPFLDSISSLPQREQIRQMVWYIADRMTYSTKIKATPAQVLAQDDVIEEAGSCMTYSYSLWFLCQQAGIPCVLLDSTTHQWTMVYVDRHWWHVDPTKDNENIRTARSWEELQDWRDNATVLYEVIGEVPMMDGSVKIDSIYVDEQPERTRFLQELMVPGSTK